MNTTITVGKAGRIVLPKLVRNELQLQAGDSLELARCAIKAQADLIYAWNLKHFRQFPVNKSRIRQDPVRVFGC